MSRRTSPVKPGFGLTLGYTLVYLSFLVLIPLDAMFVHAAQLTWEQFWTIISSPRVVAALKLSFGTVFLAALINGVIGMLLAWVLVRYTFPGRKVIEAMIDLPFALPTAVAGIALTALYAPNGLLGQFAADLGFKIAYTPLGITLALSFVTLPFVVRTIQPVLADIPREIEEAAACLGAKPLQVARYVLLPALIPLMQEQGTQEEEAARLQGANGWQIFWHVTVPNIKWGLIYGVVLSTVRAMGEFGAVSVVSGHIRGYTNTLPLHVEILYNEYNHVAAFSVASLLLLMALFILLLKQWSESRINRLKASAGEE